MECGAIIDITEKYRYLLWRIWDKTKQYAVFIMLNPSTADAQADDPTIRRCINFAKFMGYGGIKVVNLFAFRATDPLELKKVYDPVGRENKAYIQEAVKDAGVIIAAWGAKGKNMHTDIRSLLSEVPKIYCFGATKDGCPKHPLYLKANSKLREYTIIR